MVRTLNPSGEVSAIPILFKRLVASRPPKTFRNDGINTYFVANLKLGSASEYKAGMKAGTKRVSVASDAKGF